MGLRSGRRLVGAAAAASLALTLGGCASRTSVAAPTSGPASAPSRAAPCSTASLRLGLAGSPSPATGEHADIYTLTNIGARSCSLTGYPRVTLFDAKGAALPFSYVHESSQYMTDRPPVPVVLAPGGVGYVLVAKYRCDLGIAADATRIELTPPGTTTALTGPAMNVGGVGGLSYCKGGAGDPGQRVSLSPVEPTERALSPALAGP